MPTLGDRVGRGLLAAAVWRPRLSYAVATLADHTRTTAWRLCGREPPMVRLYGPRTPFRERVFSAAFADPDCSSPFPRLTGGRDWRALEGPMVLVTFHLGTVEALGAIFEPLPGPKLALWACWPVDRPGTRAVNLSRSGLAFGAKCALDTLRAGGFVFAVADGAGHSAVETDVCGRRIALPRGTFTLARLAGAPLLPLAARWRGRAIEVVRGDLIPPGDEAQMVSALAAWLEAYLAEHPDEARGDLHRLLRMAPLSNPPVSQRVLERAVPDLSGLR